MSSTSFAITYNKINNTFSCHVQYSIYEHSCKQDQIQNNTQRKQECNAEVELINPVADTVANANYRGADVDWYVKADDIVLKNKGTHAGNPQNNAPQQPPKK